MDERLIIHSSLSYQVKNVKGIGGSRPTPPSTGRDTVSKTYLIELVLFCIRKVNDACVVGSKRQRACLEMVSSTTNRSFVFFRPGYTQIRPVIILINKWIDQTTPVASITLPRSNFYKFFSHPPSWKYVFISHQRCCLIGRLNPYATLNAAAAFCSLLTNDSDILRFLCI